MLRISWIAAASSVALLGVSACAGSGSNDDLAQSAAPAAQAQMQTAAEPAPAPAATSGTYSDAQLQAFVTAAAQINPIAQSLASATEEQRAQGAEQIRSILTANNLDADTYNAIASQAQTDPALAARITALQSAQ